MQTHKASDGTLIRYNSGFRGNVTIRNPAGDEIEISGKAMLEFVAFGYVLPLKIDEIEGMSAEELLGP